MTPPPHRRHDGENDLYHFHEERTFDITQFVSIYKLPKKRKMVWNEDLLIVWKEDIPMESVGAGDEDATATAASMLVVDEVAAAATFDGNVEEEEEELDVADDDVEDSAEGEVTAWDDEAEDAEDDCTEDDDDDNSNNNVGLIEESNMATMLIEAAEVHGDYMIEAARVHGEVQGDRIKEGMVAIKGGIIGAALIGAAVTIVMDEGMVDGAVTIVSLVVFVRALLWFGVVTIPGF